MKRIVRARGADRAGQVAVACLVVFVAGLAPLPHRLTVRNDDVNTPAAIPVELLLAGLMVTAVFVTRSGFFDAD